MRSQERTTHARVITTKEKTKHNKINKMQQSIHTFLGRNNFLVGKQLNTNAQPTP